jgi:aminoglycoside 6'-N-acetyltransferase
VNAQSSPEIGFRPVRSEDLPLLAQWLARPHWQEWWGEPEAEIAIIRDMVEGRDPCRPFLFTLDGEPAGYLQLWRVALNLDPESLAQSPWMAEVPVDAVGVDLSIGDADKLSRGIGSAVLRRFARMLWAQENHTILIDPHPDNLRAVKAYGKAGFRPVPHLEGRTPGVLIMQFHQDQP